MSTSSQIPGSSGVSDSTSDRAAGIWRRLFSGRLTLDDTWLLAVPLVLLLVISRVQIRPHDFWWHLRTGERIFTTGIIPTTDLFSFTRPGYPWTNQGWLMQAALYLLHQAGGLPLVMAFYMLLLAAGYTFVEGACLRATGGRAFAAALATIAGTLVGITNWSVRPQAVSFLLFGAVVWLIETHRTRGGPVIWVLPILFALWANLHGGFVFGAGLWAIYVLCRLAADLVRHHSLTRETRRALVVSAVSLVALSLNPSGPLGTARYVLGFFHSTTTLNANLEFQPLTIRDLGGQLFFAFVILLVLLAIHSRVALPGYLVVTGIAFGTATLFAQRVLPWFGMAVAPAFALTLAAQPGLTARVRSNRRGRTRLNYAFVGLMVALLVFMSPWRRSSPPLRAELRSFYAIAETPVLATEYLCPLGERVRLFNDIGYGSYMIWACPSVPVFMDTRFELYPTEMWEDYIRIVSGQFAWEGLLAKYGINTIFASKTDQQELVPAVRSSANWELLYEDNWAVIFRAR